MKLLNYGILSVLCVSILSCTSEVKDEVEQSEEEICLYSYNEGSTTLEWTSYKTNARVGVKGGFNEITVESVESDDPKKVIESISFTINTASVETNDEGRNAKISEHFFGTIDTEEITGKVVSLNDEGEAIIEITMNSIAYEVPGDYTLEDNVFTYKSSIDAGSWDGLPGIDALNEVCKDLHTGEDGISKLWADIDIYLSTTLKSSCD